MIRVRNTLAVLAFTALFGCAVDSPASTPTTDQVNLTLHTTHATQSLSRDLSMYYTDIRSEFKLEVHDSSYTQLMAQLKDGTIDYFVSRFVPADNDIWAAPIAQDGLVLIVHPDNPISNLQSDVIRDIFSGKRTTWTDAGNANDPIMILTYQASEDVYHEFHHLVMGRQRITSNAQVVPNITAMIQEVAKTPQAIGYVPLSQLTDNVRVLAIDGVMPNQDTVMNNLYALRTTLFVIGREEPPPIYRTFFSWVQSRDGQSVAAQHYSPLP